MRFVIWILLVTLLATGKTVAANDEDYFPLLKGSKRIAEIVTTLPDGTSRRGTISSVDVEAVERGGRSYRRVKTESVGLVAMSKTYLYRRDATGLYVIFEDQADAGEQRTVMFPLKMGSTWEFTVGKRANQVSVIGYEDVTVGDKTYDHCLHLHVESNDGQIYDRWSAPKIGEVKANATHPSGFHSVITLQEFTLGE